LTGHLPVLTAEAVQQLRPERGGVFVDCTVGLGGHSLALLEAGAGRIVGLDRDSEALDRARERLAPWLDRVDLVHVDYRALDSVLDRLGIPKIDGALADLGLSALQLGTPGRGFSFQHDDPLDMRMDRTEGETAADVIARLNERELADAIFEYGEERRSRQIARAIVEARRREPPSSAGRIRAAVADESIRRPARFRRCASGSTGNSKDWIAFSKRPRGGCACTPGWW